MNVQEAERKIKELQDFIEFEKAPKEIWLMHKDNLYISPKESEEECQRWIDELHADNPDSEFNLYKPVLFREVRDDE